MKRSCVLLLLAVFFVFSQNARGGVPQLINFQGSLKDGSGNPVADGSYSVTFTIYDAPTGGNAKWTETQSVTTSNGLFTVLLGATTPVPDSVFYDASRYLGIAVSPDPEMTPRQRLASAGYSAVSSQWTSAGQNLFRLGGKVGIGESNPLNTLTIGSNGGFTSTGLFQGILMGTTSGQTKQLIIGRDEGNFVQLAYDDDFGFASARLLAEGNHPFSITSGGSLYINTGGNNSVFVSDVGNVGIGTTNPSSKLDVNNGDVLLSNQRVLRSSRAAGGADGAVIGTNASDQVIVGESPLWGAVTFSPGGLEKARITSSGTVGIGTTSPQDYLDVYGRVRARHRAGTYAGFIVADETGTFQGGFVLNGTGGPSIYAAGQGYVVNVLNSNGNVGIGTTSPGASNLLELSSTTKGLVLSRMTKAQRDAIASPVAGMMIYQTDNTPGLRVYNGTNWVRFTETVD